MADQSSTSGSQVVEGDLELVTYSGGTVSSKGNKICSTLDNILKAGSTSSCTYKPGNNSGTLVQTSGNGLVAHLFRRELLVKTKADGQGQFDASGHRNMDSLGEVGSGSQYRRETVSFEMEVVNLTKALENLFHLNGTEFNEHLKGEAQIEEAQIAALTVNTFGSLLNTAVKSGAEELQMKLPAGFQSGTEIVIDQGTPESETNSIVLKVGIGPPPEQLLQGKETVSSDSIPLATPLKFDHAAGATILKVISEAAVNKIQDEKKEAREEDEKVTKEAENSPASEVTTTLSAATQEEGESTTSVAGDSGDTTTTVAGDTTTTVAGDLATTVAGGDGSSTTSAGDTTTTVAQAGEGTGQDDDVTQAGAEHGARFGLMLQALIVGFSCIRASQSS